MPLIEAFPRADIRGVDISEYYVSLYKEKTKHPAWVGSIEELPPELGVFDYILCVTVLMYLEKDGLSKAFSNLLSHLKDDGKLILIEPHLSGFPFQTGFGVLPFFIKRLRKDTAGTRGRYFGSREIEEHSIQAGSRVLLERRLPITSFFFLPLTLAGSLLPGRVARCLFRSVSVLDLLLGRFKLPSIQVAYLVAKAKNAVFD